MLVTALDQPADRVRGLEAGAEDFLTKPIDEIALIARVRSLSRLKVVLDELRSRAATSKPLGMPDPVSAAIRDDVSGARILVIEDKAAAARQIAGTLSGRASRRRRGRPAGGALQAAPRAPTTCSSCRSACRATMVSASARNSARSSEPGMCRS